MCRPERPLTTANKALRELQEWLRDQRTRTRQGYRALAARAGCHATTLQRAASGETVPKLQTVLNYARACDASPEEARHLWRNARYEQTRQARPGRGRPVPRAAYVYDFADLSTAVQDLYERAGSPPLRIMEQRAGGFGHLPRSTAHRIATKQAMPHSLQQFQAYLRACEVPEADWQDWEAAWTRAWRQEKRDGWLGSEVGILMGRALERANAQAMQDYVPQYNIVLTHRAREEAPVREGTHRRLRVPVRESPARARRRRRSPRARVEQMQLPLPIGTPDVADPVLLMQGFDLPPTQYDT
ncbi:helix-turn-helix domain-containing protein [Streptomyces sp. NPDC058783]|uniref:helix-turn-helix domain-containing protein n=1 Tax=Streptomyces sp. NPDC058783 TaxID=3346633 RepID=UPI003690359B